MNTSYKASLYIRYESENTKFITMLPVQPIATLIATCSDLIFDLTGMVLGSILFIVMMLQPAGFVTTVCIVTALVMVAWPEWRVFNALCSLRNMFSISQNIAGFAAVA